jgi:hypothetical protein
MVEQSKRCQICYEPRDKIIYKLLIMNHHLPLSRDSRYIHSRLHWLLFAICAVLIGGTGCGRLGTADRMTLEMSPHANAQLRTAAADAARVLEKATGVPVRVVPMPRWRVYPAGTRLALDGAPLRVEGEPPFVVAGRAADQTEALYGWLRTELGVRWYVPGPHGEFVPQVPVAEVRARWGRVTGSPFLSRNYSGVGRSGEEGLWSLRNGMRERLSFNHAHYRIIRPEQMATHPELFAQNAQGEPLPMEWPGINGRNPHPALHHPAVVERMAAAARDHFAQRPGDLSFSIAANDSFTFGWLPDDYPYFDRTAFFRRYPDYSGHVYHFSNEVARLLGETHPDKYLGTLSYLMWERVPDFAVHPKIIPYLTADRSQWYDAAFRLDDEAVQRAWVANGPEIVGTWDYLFGAGFVIPRSLTQIVSESIPALWRNGVRAYFAQVDPSWVFDGHTAWLGLQLLWNPQADADALLAGYWRDMYGPAGETVAAFFGVAEAVWMRQAARTDVAPAYWLKFWNDPQQVWLWTAGDVARADALVQRAVAEVEAETVAARHVGQLQLAWTIARDAIDYLKTAAVISRDISRVLGNQPPAHLVLVNQPAFDRLTALRAHIAATQATLRAEYPFAGRWLNFDRWLWFHDPLSKLHLAEDQVRWHQAPAVLTLDASNPRWRIQLVPTEDASIVWGDLNLLWASNVRRGIISAPFAATPGERYLARVEARCNLVAGSMLYLGLDWHDSSGKRIHSEATDRLPPGQHDDGFGLGIVATAPTDAVAGRLMIRVYEMAPGEFIELRAAEVRQLSAPPANP